MPRWLYQAIENSVLIETVLHILYIILFSSTRKTAYPSLPLLSQELEKMEGAYNLTICKKQTNKSSSQLLWSFYLWVDKEDVLLQSVEETNFCVEL